MDHRKFPKDDASGDQKSASGAQKRTSGPEHERPVAGAQRLTGPKDVADVGELASSKGERAEALRGLVQQLMRSWEAERRLLARELHDDISQQMALLGLDCGAALHALEGEDGDCRERLERVRVNLANISRDLRTLSHRVYPAIVEHLGVAAALESLVDDFGRREDMQARFKAEGASPELPLQTAVGLYRIAQEVLRAIARRGGRRQVSVELRQRAQGLDLLLTEPGPVMHGRESYGELDLMSLEERARLIGGTLRLESSEGSGVHVCVVLNLPRASAGPDARDWSRRATDGAEALRHEDLVDHEAEHGSENGEHEP